METKATDRPWRYEKDSIQFRQIIYGSNGKALGTTNDIVSYRLQDNKAEANAELIVRAVNAFAPLVEALEYALVVLDDPIEEDADDLERRIHSTLALARGEA